MSDQVHVVTDRTRGLLERAVVHAFWAVSHVEDDDGEKYDVPYQRLGGRLRWLQTRVWRLLRLPCDGCHGDGGCCSCGRPESP